MYCHELEGDSRFVRFVGSLGLLFMPHGVSRAPWHRGTVTLSIFSSESGYFICQLSRWKRMVKAKTLA